MDVKPGVAGAVAAATVAGVIAQESNLRLRPIAVEITLDTDDWAPSCASSRSPDEPAQPRAPSASRRPAQCTARHCAAGGDPAGGARHHAGGGDCVRERHDRQARSGNYAFDQSLLVQEGAEALAAYGLREVWRSDQQYIYANQAGRNP